MSNAVEGQAPSCSVPEKTIDQLLMATNLEMSKSAGLCRPTGCAGQPVPPRALRLSIHPGTLRLWVSQAHNVEVVIQRLQHPLLHKCASSFGLAPLPLGKRNNSHRSLAQTRRPNQALGPPYSTRRHHCRPTAMASGVRVPGATQTRATGTYREAQGAREQQGRVNALVLLAQPHN